MSFQEMDAFDDKARKFQEMIRAAAKGLCPFCRCRPKLYEFDSPVSIHEFQMSGLCQRCQDTFFEESENEKY